MKNWLSSTTPRDIFAQIFVFLAYFLTAKLGLYVYYSFNTSPALIWPPVGIAIAAMVFGGYRMWLPIFLAQFLVVYMLSPDAYLIAFILAVAYALQAAAALALMRRFQFEPNFERLRNTLILIAIAFSVTMIEPAIATAAQIFMGTLSISPIVNFGRAWGGGIFSVLVFTCFVATWYPWKNIEIASSKKQLIAAFALLVGVDYFLFWTPYPQYVGISVIFFLPAVLIWFGLSFHPRWMTLAIFFTSVFGIAGSLFSGASAVPLNVQVLADQIYIGLVGAIFMVFVAVVEERRVAYRRLERAYQLSAASDKAKNDFIAILAHELRNPLAPIVSSFELLKLEPQTARALGVIKNAEEQTKMMRRLLDDLLDTARLSQEKFQLQKEFFSVREILEHSVASVQGFIAERQHTLEALLPEPEVILHADPVRLKQMIINLLNNAIKYTEPGGRIGLYCEERDDTFLIKVVDNGVGISPEKFSYLFEPFIQGAGSAKTNSGLGVGLFLTRRLAEMHGGRIEVASNGLGEGSVFSIVLPYFRTRSKQANQREANSMQALPTRILIVDDNRAAASVLDQLLRYHGHQVAATYSGREALALVSSFNPQVIFLDIGMPGMDGYEVAREIRGQGWRGSLVALTGYGQKRDKDEARDAGFDYHLVKPVTIKDVINILSNIQFKEAGYSSR